MSEPSVDQLRHELDATAIRFEMYVSRLVDAESPEFEDWRDAFSQAFDNPKDEKAGLTADIALEKLLKTL